MRYLPRFNISLFYLSSSTGDSVSGKICTTLTVLCNVYLCSPLQAVFPDDPGAPLIRDFSATGAGSSAHCLARRRSLRHATIDRHS